MSFCQHIRVIVALEEDGIEGREHIPESIKDMSEVGHNAEPFVPGCDDKGCSISAVMGGRYGLDRDFFEIDHTVTLKIPHIMNLTEGMPFDRSIEGLFCNVQRESVFSLVNACISYMVAVIMGNNHGIDIPDIASS